MTIHVLIKSLTKQSAAVNPHPFELRNRPETAGEFLDEAVTTCLCEFEAGQGLFACLTGQELEDMAQGGKISFDGHNGGAVNVEKAIANARQCFEDGMVRVILDEKRLESLDEAIDISEDSVAVFIRLSMLSGRYW